MLLSVPEVDTVALDLTCAECGRSPRADETWRIVFVVIAEASPTAPSARSVSSAGHKNDELNVDFGLDWGSVATGVVVGLIVGAIFRGFRWYATRRERKAT
jgi:hypothetical protein